MIANPIADAISNMPLHDMKASSDPSTNVAVRVPTRELVDRIPQTRPYFFGGIQLTMILVMDGQPAA